MSYFIAFKSYIISMNGVFQASTRKGEHSNVVKRESVI